MLEKYANNFNIPLITGVHLYVVAYKDMSELSFLMIIAAVLILGGVRK